MIFPKDLFVLLPIAVLLAVNLLGFLLARALL
jgi:hypothetical protein